MGRIVGDGAMYFYLQDIAIIPEHQGHGVGRRIVDRLAAFINANAPHQAFVGLFAASGTEPWYGRWGLQVYPALTGMFQVTPLPVPDDVAAESEAG